MNDPTPYPIPYLTKDTRIALDHEAGDLLGFTFTALVLHCRSTGWRPAGQRRLALRVAVEVALARARFDGRQPEVAPAPQPEVGGTMAEQVEQHVARFDGRQPEVDDADAAASSTGGTMAEQVVQLVGSALYLEEEDKWVLEDGSVLDIGEGYARAFPPGAVPTSEEDDDDEDDDDDLEPPPHEGQGEG